MGLFREACVPRELIRAFQPTLSYLEKSLLPQLEIRISRGLLREARILEWPGDYTVSEGTHPPLKPGLLVVSLM